MQAAQAAGQVVAQGIGAWSDMQRDEALKNANSILSNPNATQEDLDAAQRFLNTADSWSEGGLNNRTALHVIGGGLIGGLGGGSIGGAAGGAAGAGMSSYMADHTREFADSVGGGLIGNLAGNVLNGIGGAIIGGGAGASTASSVNLYNQQNDKKGGEAAKEAKELRKILDQERAALGQLAGTKVSSDQPVTVRLPVGALSDGASPRINPANIAGKPPREIANQAIDMGLVSKGPNPMSGQGAYVGRVTGQQRILTHPAEPCPHCHVNDSSGARLDIHGNPVAPESPAAHLPLSN